MTQVWVTLTGWDVLAIVVGWAAGMFVLGFAKGLRYELREADKVFDDILRRTVEYFPDDIITIKRGPLFWRDDVSLTINKRVHD